MLPIDDSVDQIYNTDPIYICYPGMTQLIRCTIPTLSTYATLRRLSRSDRQCWPYLHMSRCEDSVDQIYNTDPIYQCLNEKTQFIRYTIPTLCTYATMIRLGRSVYNTDSIYICYQEKTQSIRYTIPTVSTYITMRRLNRSDIQYRFYLHMLPREDSVDQIYNTDPIYICYQEKTQSIRYTITDPIYIYYHREDSVDQIYNTDPIYICYHEKTQSIRYTIPTLSTYVTMRRLSSSDIQYRPYLHMLPWEDSVHQIYNTTLSTYITHEKTQSIRYTIPTLSTYITMRRLSQSDIQYRPYLHILPREDSVNQIYNTDPIYIYYHEKTQSIRYTIPTLSTYVSVNQIYNTDPIYICYHEKTQSIRYTIPTISTYVTMRRLSQSDIQYRPYLHILPWEDSVNQIYNTDPIYIYYPWEDSVNQIYNTDPIYICYHEKTQSIRYTIPTLSTYVTMRRLSHQIYNTDHIYIYTMRRLSQSDIQYRPYLHILPWEDSVNQIYNTDPIYICYHEKTQSIRYTIPTLSTYVTKRRLSQSDIQYRPYLHMLPREDSVNQIYNTDPIYIYYPWEDSVNQIYNTDPIYICYHEKTQSIRYTIPTLSTYVTMRRLNQSDIQYRPYLHMLPWEDSVNQIYNTDPIYICYQEKTQSIRYTIPTLSTYVTMRRLSQSDIQYRPYLHMLPWEDSVNQIYNTDPIYICYHEKTQSIRYTIPTLSTYVTKRRLSQSDIQYRPYLHMLPMRRLSQSDIQYRPYLHMLPWEDSINQIYNTDHIYIYYHEKTQSIRYTIPTLSTYVTMRRLSQSDIQYRPYLHMLPWEDSVNQIYNTDPIYICYQENRHSQSDIQYRPYLYICYHEKTQSIRYTIPTLSTYVTKRRLSQSDIQYRPYLHILPMRRLSQSDIQYRPYLHILPWEDSVNQIYNTDPIYICYHEKTQSIRYTIPTLSTYVTKRRLSQSDIQYRPYLHMLPREDSVNQIYNTDPIYIYYPWEDSVNQIYNTDPIYICYHEKTQSIRYTIPTLSTYITMRRLSSSDTQYRPYLHMLPWEDSINQINNTDHIYICYHEKTQSIR